MPTSLSSTSRPMHYKSKPTAATKALPVELWHEILLHAASDPSIHDMDYSPVPLSDEIDDSLVAIPLLPPILRDRCTLVSVCKTWRHIAFPMLYETLWICDQEHARQLRLVLTEEGSSGETPPRTRLCAARGRLVRRIYITSPESWSKLSFSQEKMQADELGQTIGSMIPLCTSLKSIYHRGRTRGGSHEPLLRPIFAAIVDSSAAHTLRKLDFGNLGWSQTGAVWQLMAEYLGVLPALETLIIPSHGTNRVHLPSVAKDTLRAPHLRTLVLPVSCYVALRTHPELWAFPALDTIHLKSVCLLTALDDHLLATLHALPRDDALNGAVRSLCFDAPSRWLAQEFSTRARGFDLLAFFPRLADVVLPVLELDLPCERVAHGALARIGLSHVLFEHDVEALCAGRVAERVAERTQQRLALRIDRLEKTMDAVLQGELPRLRIVRLVDPPFEEYVRRYRAEWVANWVRRLAERKIALEWSSLEQRVPGSF